MKRVIILLTILIIISSCTIDQGLNGIENNGLDKLNKIKDISLIKEKFEVKQVINWNSFELVNGEKITLIGISIPPSAPEESYKEAENKLKELVENKKVGLEKDMKEKDEFGKLPRYVFVDKDFINFILIQEGFVSYFEDENKKYSKELKQAEDMAKENSLRIWKKIEEYREKLEEQQEEETGIVDVGCGALGCSSGTQYVASINGDFFIGCNCRYAPKINREDIICFENKTEAESNGFTEARTC